MKANEIYFSSTKELLLVVKLINKINDGVVLKRKVGERFEDINIDDNWGYIIQQFYDGEVYEAHPRVRPFTPSELVEHTIAKTEFFHKPLKRNRKGPIHITSVYVSVIRSYRNLVDVTKTILNLYGVNGVGYDETHYTAEDVLEKFVMSSGVPAGGVDEELIKLIDGDNI